VSPQKHFGSPASKYKQWEVEQVPTGTCPECDADVHVDTDADKGDIVSCEECGTDLELVGLDPVELDIVEEDYDDDEDEDEF
jgi:alpha-aminoadipate carrier protein LysW